MPPFFYRRTALALIVIATGILIYFVGDPHSVELAARGTIQTNNSIQNSDSDASVKEPLYGFAPVPPKQPTSNEMLFVPGTLIVTF